MSYMMGCTGKIPYTSEREAKHVLRNTRNGHHIYHCHYFDHWHVTHLTKKVAKKIVKKRWG